LLEEYAFPGMQGVDIVDGDEIVKLQKTAAALEELQRIADFEVQEDLPEAGVPAVGSALGHLSGQLANGVDSDGSDSDTHVAWAAESRTPAAAPAASSVGLPNGIYAEVGKTKHKRRKRDAQA
jgi:hypothetical protein